MQPLLTHMCTHNFYHDQSRFGQQSLIEGEAGRLAEECARLKAQVARQADVQASKLLACPPHASRAGMCSC